MKFILSQELSRHNRDKKCVPIEPQVNSKTYEISYDTIDVLPTYAIVIPTDTVTTSVCFNIGTVTSTATVPIIEGQHDFAIRQLNSDECVNTEVELISVKSWNCEICSFQ